MSRNTKLFSKVDRALNSDDVYVQGNALSSLIQSVSRYVQQIKADEEIIGQIRNYERRVSSLRTDKSPEAQEELQEAKELLEKSKKVEYAMRKKIETIESLKRDVATLHRALSDL